MGRHEADGVHAVKKHHPSPTDIAFACATVLRVPLLKDRRAEWYGIPTGIAWGSVERYIVTGLREYNWPLTKLSLRVAQMRSERDEKAASERLWSEENP